MSRLKHLAAHSRPFLAIAISVVSLGGCLWWATKQEAPDFPSSLDGILLILAAVAVLRVLLRRERRAEQAGEAHLLPSDPEAIRVPVER